MLNLETEERVLLSITVVFSFAFSAMGCFMCIKKCFSKKIYTTDHEDKSLKVEKTPDYKLREVDKLSFKVIKELDVENTDCSSSEGEPVKPKPEPEVHQSIDSEEITIIIDE